MADVADQLVTTLEKTVADLRRRVGVPPYDPANASRRRAPRRPRAGFRRAARGGVGLRAAAARSSRSSAWCTITMHISDPQYPA